MSYEELIFEEAEKIINGRRYDELASILTMYDMLIKKDSNLREKAIPFWEYCCSVEGEK